MPALDCTAFDVIEGPEGASAERIEHNFSHHGWFTGISDLQAADRGATGGGRRARSLRDCDCGRHST